METSHITDAMDSASKSGLSWTKRSRMVSDCLGSLIELGRRNNTKKIVAECVTITVSAGINIDITVTGNATHESINIGLRPDASLTLEGYPCDINAISQRIAQLLLSNKPQETMQALVYC